MRASAMLVALALACGTANAQPAGEDYFEHHTFTLKNLVVRPGQTYRGLWHYYINAWEMHDWRPPRLWDGQQASDNMLLPEGPQAGIATTRELICTPDAQANSGFQLALDANNHPTGSVDVWGHARLAAAPAIQEAFAKSESSLSVQIGTRQANGRVKWKPQWHAAGSAWGDTRAGSRDPIFIRSLDLDTGEMLDTTLWDSLIDIRGEGGSNWENGLLQINANEGELLLEIMSPFSTTGTGRMHLMFSNGVVTASEDEGMFDGLLPLVGASSHDISMQLGDAEGAFELGFDMGSSSVNGYDMTFTLANDGEASSHIVPSTSGATVLAGAGVLALAARPRRRA